MHHRGSCSVESVGGCSEIMAPQPLFFLRIISVIMFEPTKIQNIQALRAIAAIMVVLLHIALRAESIGYDSWALPFQYIGFAGVDIFFVISGLVMTITTYRHLGDKKYAIHFIQKRATRIYSNYWIILIIKLLFIWAGLNNGLREGISIVGSITLFPGDQSNLIIAVAWTLMLELFFYFIFSLAILFPKKYFSLFLSLWAAIILSPILFIFERTNSMPFLLNFYFSPFFLEFIAGCFIGILINKRLIIFPSLFLLTGSVLFILTAIITKDTPLVSHADTLKRVVFYGGSASLILYGAVALEVSEKFVFPKWMALFGNASYTIYLIHGVILQAIFFAIFVPYFSDTSNVYLQHSFTIFTLCVVLGYSLFHYRAIERPLIGWCNERFKTLLKF
jgi:exopolysaccharide production protein ExoZ